MMLESAIEKKKLTWLEAERITGVKEPELRKRLEETIQPPSPPADSNRAEPFTLRLADSH
jgi:hypothetical protein